MKLLSLIIKFLLAIIMLLPGEFAAGQVAVVSGGPGSSSGTGGANNQGSAASGLGCGGGGAGYWGGNGGNGKYGGGGGGASGFGSTWHGGTGGQGVVVIAYYNEASFVSSVVLVAGTSVSVGVGITQAKVWAIGAGGGGAGATTSDSDSGGGGAAGGVSYITKEVSSGNTISYSLGTAGAYGSGANNGSSGGNTTITIAGTTITGNGGGGGYFNNNTNGTGGPYSGGDGGSTGGAGKGSTSDQGGGGGGGIGGVIGGTQTSAGGAGANAGNVSELFAACASASMAVPPVVSSFTPTSGSTGTSIIITGTGFSGVTSVSFGGTAAASYVVNSGLQISAVVGAGTTGSVSVANVYGTGSLAGFTAIVNSNHILGLGTQQIISASGSTVDWTVPVGTTSIQVIAVGGGGSGGAAYWAGGGGGGGALAYKTKLNVTAGSSCTVYAGRGGNGIDANAGGQGTSGASSYLTYSGTTIGAAGGTAGTGTNSNTNTPYAGGIGGAPYSTFDGGGNGGTGGTSSGDTGGGGAGAGGYTGKGGNGGWTIGSGGSGAGGANGGNNGTNGAAQSGGGTGLSGLGTSATLAGRGGSGGANGSANATAGGASNTGGLYGGGGGGQSNDSKATPGCNGGGGAVAIYSGYTATYGDAPITLTAKATSGLTITYSTSEATVATVSGNILTITGAGTCTIFADQAGNGTYPAATRVSQTLNVASSFPGITTAALSAVGSTTATCGGTVTTEGGFSVTAKGVCWGSSTSPTITDSKTTNGTGTGAFVSTIAGLTTGTKYYVRAYATSSYGTSYGTQTSFTPFQLGAFSAINKTYGNPTFVLVNPTSGSPGSFSYESSETGVATISGNTVTITGAGTSTITATQAASGNYGSATTSALLTVALADQVLTLRIPTSAKLNTFYETPIGISATSSSSLGVTVTLGGTATSVLGGTIGSYTLSGVSTSGTVIVTADQAGNANYNAATLSQTFDVDMGNQEITFNVLTGKTFGDAAFTLTATGGSSVNPVTFTSSNSDIATCTGTNGTTVTILGAGTVAITANQAGTEGSWNPAAAVTRNLTIAKATPLITIFSNTSKTWGDASFALAASSASTGAFTYSSGNTAVATISGNTVTITGAGSSTLTAAQAADANYNSVSADVTLTVAPANQTLTITGLPTDISLLAFEGASIQASATSTSGLTVTLTLGGASPATIDETKLITSSGATGTVTVNASQAGNTNFNSASASQTFTVSKLNQTITFDALSVKNVGDPVFDFSASSTSSLNITFTSSNTGVAAISGKSATIGVQGTSDVTASQAGDAYYNAATSVVHTLTVQPCASPLNPTNGGVISENQNGCNPYNPALIVSTSLPSGQNGTLEYRWQLSTTSSSTGFSDIASSNADAYDPAIIKVTTWYKRLSRVTCISDWALATSSNVVEITLYNSAPATPGAISGTAQQCAGSTGQTYSVSAVTNATTYTWTVPTGWSVTAGAGTNTITVTAGSGGQNGNITVTAGNACGNSAAVSKAVTVSAVTVGETVKW